MLLPLILDVLWVQPGCSLCLLPVVVPTCQRSCIRAQGSGAQAWHDGLLLYNIIGNMYCCQNRRGAGNRHDVASAPHQTNIKLNARQERGRICTAARQ